MTIRKQIAATISAGALLLNVAMPVMAEGATFEISGNGAGADSTIEAQVSHTTVVSQTNDFSATNTVSATSNTGDNGASYNTNGDVTVTTGNASSVAGVSNEGNTNTANVQNCGGCDMNADVLISGNGAYSDNAVGLSLSNGTVVAQANNSDFVNKVYAKSETGDNDGNFNTGGDVHIMTGKAATHVEIANAGNSNWARVAGDSVLPSNGGVSLRILGNGVESDNAILLGLSHDVLLQQYNSASVLNWVDADADTGDNTTSKNTGGSSSIMTGDADAVVLVENALNFNWADVDCDCLMNVTGKVSGNGVYSDNVIKASVADNLNVFQDNSCGYEYGWFWFGNGCLDNHLNADATSGDNDSWKNTGAPGMDPSIMTGDAESVVGVENSGNTNVYGVGVPSIPGLGGFNVNISFDLSALLALIS